MSNKPDDHDKVEELLKWKTDQEKMASYEKGARDQWHRICRLSTTAILFSLSCIGKIAYDHMPSVTAAVKAFWAAWYSGDGKP